ncbi:Plant self-incompatibility protein S1 family [Striga hermonthica]|uniref:S-protein homolog n=1 Tax=Striga hermonthica TaxID=68872 RepID=A0A9N7RP48_STRHE|nr:Plant self-incompatibility protein S1 family [Striga hermonthica]
MYSDYMHWLVILLTVSLFISSRSTRTNGIGLLQTYRVYVINNFSYDTNELMIHCKSGDDDLGYHFLSQYGSWHWKFRVDLFGSTLFFCRVQWGELETSFTVFDTDYISSKCEGTSTCFWSLREDGIYFSCDDLNYVQRYIWP